MNHHREFFFPRARQPPLQQHHRVAPPRQKTAAAAVSRAAKEETWGRNPNSGKCTLIAQSNWQIWSTGQLVNSGQLVKVSSQHWSKLQIWLNERGRIGNLTAIMLLIN